MSASCDSAHAKNPLASLLSFRPIEKGAFFGYQNGVRVHQYIAHVRWSGGGEGTASYRSYSRNFTINAQGKPDIAGSSDPVFRGDATRYNPEELLVASLSSCHMLWYLHLCSVNEIVVLEYRDDAIGTMEERDGVGAFVRVTLRPAIKVSAGNDLARAIALHEEAHRLCFIARSVNFPVGIEAEVVD
jgi:organic hydroperoxide reductase OsmC/OhrA